MKKINKRRILSLIVLLAILVTVIVVLQLKLFQNNRQIN